MLYPVELRARNVKFIARSGARIAAIRRMRIRTYASECGGGRGRGIRTLDIQLPKLALYQAELYPDENEPGCIIRAFGRTSLELIYTSRFLPHRHATRKSYKN